MELGNYKTKRNIPVTDMKGKQIKGVIMRDQIITIHSTKKTKVVHRTDEGLQTADIWMGRLVDPMRGWVQLVGNEGETLCEHTTEEWPDGKPYEIMMMDGSIPKVPKRRIEDHNKNLKKKLGSLLKKTTSSRLSDAPPALPKRKNGALIRSSTMGIDRPKKPRIDVVQRSMTEKYQIVENDDEEESSDYAVDSPVSISLPTPRNLKAESIPNLPAHIFDRPPPRSRSRQNKARSRPAPPSRALRSLSPRPPPPPPSNSRSPVHAAALSEASESPDSGDARSRINSLEEEDVESIPSNVVITDENNIDETLPDLHNNDNQTLVSEPFEKSADMIVSSDSKNDEGAIQNDEAVSPSELQRPDNGGSARRSSRFPRGLFRLGTNLSNQSSTSVTDSENIAPNIGDPELSESHIEEVKNSTEAPEPDTKEHVSSLADRTQSQIENFEVSRGSEFFKAFSDEVNVYAMSDSDEDLRPAAPSDPASAELVQQSDVDFSPLPFQPVRESEADLMHTMASSEKGRESVNQKPATMSEVQIKKDERIFDINDPRFSPPSRPRNSIRRPLPPPRKSIQKSVTPSSPKPPPTMPPGSPKERTLYIYDDFDESNVEVARIPDLDIAPTEGISESITQQGSIVKPVKRLSSNVKKPPPPRMPKTKGDAVEPIATSEEASPPSNREPQVDNSSEMRETEIEDSSPPCSSEVKIHSTSQTKEIVNEDASPPSTSEIKTDNSSETKEIVNELPKTSPATISKQSIIPDHPELTQKKSWCSDRPKPPSHNPTMRPQESLRRKLKSEYLDGVEKVFPDESGNLSVEVSSKKFGGKLIVDMDADQLVLQKVAKGGLAQRLGLQNGDVLICVDGNTWDGSSLMLKRSWKRARTPFKAIFKRENNI